jgi:hypothetical protein
MLNFEKLSARLLTGEGTRDVVFLAHVIVEVYEEGQIAKQLKFSMPLVPKNKLDLPFMLHQTMEKECISGSFNKNSENLNRV